MKMVIKMSEKNPINPVDIPFFLKMLELSRENLKTDEIIHTITERLVELSASGKTLTMQCFPEILSITKHDHNMAVEESTTPNVHRGSLIERKNHQALRDDVDDLKRMRKLAGLI